jgi:spore germination protein YaaH
MIDQYRSRAFHLVLILIASCVVNALHAQNNATPLVLSSQHPNIGAQIPSEFIDHHDVIDILAPMWVDVDDKGNVSLLPNVKESIANYVDAAHQRNTQVWPIVRNFSPMPVLTNSQALANCADQLEQWTLDNKVDGLIIDFERLDAAARVPLNELMQNLYSRFKPRKIKLSIAVPAHTWHDEVDYLGLSKNCDYLYVMFYDYVGPWNKRNGPTAPLFWPELSRDIARDLDRILGFGVKPQTILLGLASYGIDMAFDKQNNVTDIHVDYIDPLRELMTTHNVKEQWDASKQSPYFQYTDKQGNDHRVWYENQRSYQAKIDYAQSKGLPGVAIWAIRWADKPSSITLWQTLKAARQTADAQVTQRP